MYNPSGEASPLRGITPAELMPEVSEIIHPLPAEEGVFLSREIYPTKTINGVARIAGAEVRYTYELPQQVIDEVPLLIVPGYGGVKSAYQRLRQTVAAHGKPAVSFRPPRNQSMLGGLSPAHLLQPSKLQSQASWAVMRDIEMADGPGEFDLLAHSMGGQTAINAALHKPEHVRSIIFMASAGLDLHTLRDMRERGTNFLKEELFPNLGRLAMGHHPKIAPDTLHYIFRNSRRTIQEGISVANCDIREKVKSLGGIGIKTAALQFPADRLFPLDGVVKHSSKLFDVFRVYSDPNAGHLTPQLDPVNVARANLSILEELHRSKEVAA